MSEAEPTVRFLLDDNSDQLAHDVREGLGGDPKAIPSKWFYDERGSKLFEQIMALPEYYVTRQEEACLQEYADDMAQLAGAGELVELGAGNSAKTRVLLDALCAPGNGERLRKFVLFDVSEEAVRETAGALSRQYPQLVIEGIVGDFDHHLDEIGGNHNGVYDADSAGGPDDPSRHDTTNRMFIFLGGTIGNFDPTQRNEFLAEVASGMKAGDTFLLGTDLVKSPERLHAAYNDAQGVTADFNLNVLRVINRELDADFVLDQFRHVAVWVEGKSRVEMRLRSLCDQNVFVGKLGLDVAFSAGEEMRTEISTKFRPEQVEAELAQAGFEVLECWTDPQGDFQLTMARLVAGGRG